MFEYILIVIFILVIYLTVRKERKAFFNIWFVFLVPAVFIVYSIAFQKTEMNLFSIIWISVFMAFMLAALIAYMPDLICRFSRKKNKHD